MSQRSLANWIKAIVIGVGLGGVLIYFGLDMFLGSLMINGYIGQSIDTYFWNILILTTLVPCYGVLFLYGKWLIKLKLIIRFHFKMLVI